MRLRIFNESWCCPQCGEVHEPQFDACWHCGFDYLQFFAAQPWCQAILRDYERCCDEQDQALVVGDYQLAQLLGGKLRELQAELNRAVNESMSWVKQAVVALQAGQPAQVRPHGGSMRGRIESGQLVTISPVNPQDIQPDDVAFIRWKGNYFSTSSKRSHRRVTACSSAATSARSTAGLAAKMCWAWLRACWTNHRKRASSLSFQALQLCMLERNEFRHHVLIIQHL